MTGMISYKELDVADPWLMFLKKLNLKWMAGIVAVSAVVAIASVLLVVPDRAAPHMDEHEP